ncbi:MAG: valine--tRNA ligase, partial [Saprospiraceae bacterium]|nr:valine--tRNA ligase [Saprospiraceae bacterium]
ISPFPKGGEYNDALIKKVDTVISLISQIRKVRNEKGIKQKEPLLLFADSASGAGALLELPGLESTLTDQAYLSGVDRLNGDGAPENALSIVIGQQQFFLQTNETLDVGAELQRLQEEIDYQKGFLNSVDRKLSNERFVNNAPDKVVDMERKKKSDAEAKIKHLQEAIDKLQ